MSPNATALAKKQQNMQSSGNKRQAQFRNTSSDTRPMKATFKGKAYASNSQYYKHGPNSNQGAESEDDGAMSDFKTTALRFTNNNFVQDSR